MDNNPKKARKFRLAGLLGLPLGGMLLGMGGMGLWLYPPTAPAEPVPHRAVQAEPLKLITAKSLYMNDFSVPSLARDTWEEAQGLMYAKVASPRAASLAFTDKDAVSLLTCLLDIVKVQEAHAETNTANGAPKETQTKNKPDPKAQKSAPADKSKNAPADKNKSAPADKSKNAPTDKNKSKPEAAQSQPVMAEQPQVSGQTSGQASGQTSGQASGQAAGKTGTEPQAVAQAPQALSEAAPRPVAEAPQAKPEAARPESPAFPQAFSAGTLGHMTQLRAELEQLKLQVTIEEARSRLNQLRGVSSAPSATRMPSLDYPPIGMPAAPRDNGLRILSIQSVNGKFTATVGTQSGPRVVSKDDTINGSRVVSISRNSVVINRGQGNETLSIQD